MIIKLKKLLTVQQILHVSTLGNVYRIVWRICILISGCKVQLGKSLPPELGFLEDRLQNWFEGYITQSIYKGINHEDVVSDAWIN